jgi:hypothetical protein
MSQESTEVTTVINRHIKPGHDADYAEWFGRILEVMKKFPGYRGVTVVVPGGSDPDARIILYRFADTASMEKWENSAERNNLLSELDRYSIQVYTKATGLETWFELPNIHSVVPPPKWKMAAVTLLAAGIVSFISHFILGAYLETWPLVVTSIVYSAILVLVLTYFAMPNLTRLLKKWLYPVR